MSGIPRTNEELLKCASPVDRAMFPKAKDDMIAQDYGKQFTDKNIDRYQYIFFLSCK